MTYKQQFIKFMVENGVLKFGEFMLKSGRKAPYFINTGNYKSGAQLAKLGEYYAKCIAENNIEAETLVGPAYKGIPLAVTTAVALAEKFGKDLNYCFDRKEAKDHGEGGLFVGKQLQDGERVIIIEDVMTSGKALREMLPKLKAAANVEIAGMVISVDRMERGLESNLSAVQEVYKEFGVKVYSIVTMADIIEAIETGVIGGKEYLAKMKEYRKAYGVEMRKRDTTKYLSYPAFLKRFKYIAFVFKVHYNRFQRLRGSGFIGGIMRKHNYFFGVCNRAFRRRYKLLGRGRQNFAVAEGGIPVNVFHSVRAHSAYKP